MKLFRQLAELCAIIAGVILMVVTLVTCASLIGRNTIGWTLVGDFELTAAVAGMAIALFMPWCQVQRGHVIVDFFTALASTSTQALLDRVGAAVLALVLALVGWRSALGGFSAWETQSGSMMLGWPEWTSYAVIVPAMALSSLIALHQAVFGFGKTQEAAV